MLVWLLDRRLSDQASIAERLLGRPEQAGAIHALRQVLHEAPSVSEAMMVEARAADRYWPCWGGVWLRFATSDRSRVPEHWCCWASRHSPLLSGASLNRHAADPKGPPAANVEHRLSRSGAGRHPGSRGRLTIIGECLAT